jgi:hypothetical protein
MPSWDLSRCCGLAAMVGGVLWATQNILVLAVEEIRWTEGVFSSRCSSFWRGCLVSTSCRRDATGP